MKSGDIAGGLRLCRASGWNQLEEDWRLIVESPGSGAWLAERDGGVIGTAALMRYDTLAWIAMMLVDPAERRSGLGSRLLAEALAAADGAPSVGLDATPAGEPLYRRFDFVGDCSLVRAKATIDASRFGNTSGTARPMTPTDLPAVISMDREAFGADRGRLLAWLLSRAPECAWVAPGRGYCFGRPGHLYWQLGPVIAADGATARDLTTRCLCRLNGRKVAMDSRAGLPARPPAEGADWLNWLKSSGFVEERPFLRMFLRGQVHPGIPSRQFAICGPEFA